MKHFIIFLIALFSFRSAIPAAEPTFKSLLVSIQRYELAPLDFVDNDIEKLAFILMTRYDCQSQACIDNAPLPGETGKGVPKKSIMRKIESWTKSLGEEDTALLYLTGHGVKDAEGKLYLAMIDFDTENFDTAAIPIAWIRDQFDNKGKNKLLLIDTCFAGTDKSIDFKQATSGEISKSFADQKNIVTIASCQENEKSWTWGEAKHSLFTFWFIEAFKGHADLDNDRVITCNELVRYLKNNVPWVAQTALGRDQNPIILNEMAGRELALALRPVDLNQLIDDIAEQIDLQMRMEKFTQIGIPEFTSGPNRTFDPQCGALPGSITESLRKSLLLKTRKNKSGYEVLSENALREMLQSKGISPLDLGTDKTKGLTIGDKEIPLLIDGRVELFRGGVALRANLLDTKGKSEIGEAGGVAVLNAKQLAMTNVSGNFATAQVSPITESKALVLEPTLGLISERQRQETEKVWLEQEKSHPMADPKSPFKVRFEIKEEVRRAISQRGRPTGRYETLLEYRPRNIIFDGNQCYLPLSKGEEYRIIITVDTNHTVFARVLVDGLNTLSQKEFVVAQGTYLESVDNELGVYVEAPRTNLEDARAWVLKSKETYKVEGFYTPNSANSTLKRFQIVDADLSAAARKGYAEQVGLITIAFFKPADRTRAVGTGMGRAERVRLEQYTGNEVPGEIMAVYNIRYMTPEALKQLLQ